MNQETQFYDQVLFFDSFIVEVNDNIKLQSIVNFMCSRNTAYFKITMYLTTNQFFTVGFQMVNDKDFMQEFTDYLVFN